MAPTISGLTLGLAGQSHLPAQLGRNEAWNHAGNGLSAMLGGAIGYWYGVPGVFVVMSGMLLLSLYALHGIAPRDIDHAQARGLAPEAEHATPAQRAALRHGPAALPVLCVGLVMLFFHLGNAHMLPLLGQSAVARFAINGAAYTAATVVIAQGTMILVALWAARLARRRGYGILLWCALLALPLRGCIAGFWHSPWSIIPVQILDGRGRGHPGRGHARPCRPAAQRHRPRQPGPGRHHDPAGHRRFVQRLLRRAGGPSAGLRPRLPGPGGRPLRGPGHPAGGRAPAAAPAPRPAPLEDS